MNSTLYLVRNKRSEAKVNSFIQKYEFELCYDAKKEKVLKNESVLISFKHKYIFLRVMTEDHHLLSEVQ